MDSKEDIQAALQKVPWFNSLTPEHFRKTVNLTHLRQVKAGEVFFREGDKSWMVASRWIFLSPTMVKSAFAPPKNMMYLGGQALHPACVSGRLARWQFWTAL
jgi:hypothetical protein